MRKSLNKNEKKEIEVVEPELAVDNIRDNYIKESDSIRKGNIVEKDGVYYTGIDVILNLYEPLRIVELLDKVFSSLRMIFASCSGLLGRILRKCKLKEWQ